MINVSSLLGVRAAPSDALRYGRRRDGEVTPPSSRTRRPVVVWSVTRECNLACRHCYATAKRRPSPDELTGAEARTLLDDLARYRVPAVLLSGGEPLTRPDLPELISHGSERGLRFTLSTNGTLIDPHMARVLADSGITYAGVSLDGPPLLHDRLRVQAGAWLASVSALRNLADAGVRRGVRFTITPQTIDGLGDVLRVVLRERVERFCMYHLVPSGRGGTLSDVSAAQRRRALHTVFGFAERHPHVEVLTVGSPADGAAVARWLEARDELRAARCREMLRWNAGALAGSGVGIANVDERGEVHPDQFSRHRTFGNVRRRPFSAISSDAEDAYLQALRSTERPLPDACRACTELDLCGGGMRVRAELATGDPWSFDHACILGAA